MIRVVLLVLMLAAGAAPQTRPARKPAPAPPPAPAPAPTRWPVETLAVEGSRHYPAARILKAAGLRTGQLAGKEEFEAARDRLIATGLFETVGYRFAPAPGQQGYAATFEVVEVEPVYPLRFEDLDLPDADVLAWLDAREPVFGPQAPGTRAVLDRFSKSIQALLAARNKEEKVVGRVVATGPGQFAILFRPGRPAAAVAQVSFSGNEVIPTRALQEAISGVGIGVAYKEETFRVLLDNSIRPLYDARGRIRVAFPKVSAEPATDVQGLHVKVAVEEGGVYNLGSVKFEGAPGFNPADLLKTAKIKTGEIANFDDVKAGVERVRTLVQRNGYLHPETKVERLIDDAKHAVDVAVHVEPGPLYLFGALKIQGLDLNGEAAIRKMWAIQPGKPFRAGYPEFFLNRVREDGVFDNLNKTRADTKIDEQNRTVDVTLYFNK